MTSDNRGWTFFGRKHHRAVWHTPTPKPYDNWFAFVAACGTAILDQTVVGSTGEPTGALIPPGFKACRKKACCDD